MGEHRVNLETAMPQSDIGARAAPRALLVSGDIASERAAEAAATLSGVRIIDRADAEAAVGRIAEQASIDIVVIEGQAIVPDLLDPIIDAAIALATAIGARIVASFSTAQIDHVAARLLGLDVQLLCAPSIVERTGALAIAAAPTGYHFADRAREGEAERLRLLNDEVARIAETLARLTRAGSAATIDAPPFDTPGSVNDRKTGYGQGGVAEAGPARIVRGAIRARRMRARFFDGDLFADPAWDMLLDLYASHLEGARVSVSSLCIAAAVPATTALRWIATMSEAGMFDRHDDPLDRRRAYIALSDDARAAMQRYAVATAAAGLAIA